MDTLRSVAHLQRQIGDDRFQALISSDNTSKIKAFCDDLIRSSIPTELTIGGRTYEILGFLKEKERFIVGDTLVDRAEEMKADLGKEDGQHFLKHQNDIPAKFRNHVTFVFTGWRHPKHSKHVAYLCWQDDRWILYWRWIWYGSDWNDNCRFPRRK